MYITELYENESHEEISELFQYFEYESYLVLEEMLVNDWQTGLTSSDDEILQIYYNEDVCYKLKEKIILLNNKIF